MASPGYNAVVDRLIVALGRLPGIGARSSERLAHHLLKCPPEEALELAEAIRTARDQIRHCQVCFHLTEADQPLCSICRDPRSPSEPIASATAPVERMTMPVPADRRLVHRQAGLLPRLEPPTLQGQ